MHITTTGAANALLIALFPIVGGAACTERGDPTAPEAVAAPAQVQGVVGIVASVRGSGHIRRPDGTSRIFTLEAAKYADGGVSGTYNLETAGPETPVRVKGNITCLVVDGSSAYIGGDVSRFDANPFPTVPGGIAIEIIDNGEGAGADPDLLSPAFFTETQQEVLDYCAAPLPGPVFATEQGNFQVR
jgi:hypothetical protein